MSHWPMIPLKELLTKSTGLIQIHPDRQYKEVTVRLWGNGVALRREVLGAEIASSARFEVHTNQFIISRIDARNGASGLIPADLDGAIVSNDFPVFTPNPKRLQPEFLNWLSKTRGFIELCKAASEGTTNRVHLKEDRFLTTTISLPPPDEQRRLVEKIEALLVKIEEAKRLRAESTTRYATFRDAKLSSFFPESGHTVVAEYVSVQNGYAFKSEWFVEDGVRLARNTNVGHGKLDWTETARIPTGMAPTFARFDLAAGDILISLDRPLISTGVKVARVTCDDLPSLLLQRVGRVQFRDDRLSPDYFFEWLHSPKFSKAIDPGRSNGVPHISSKDIERIPFSPPDRREQAIILGQLAAFGSRSRGVQKAQAMVDEELNALFPAVLDRAFRGEL